MSIRATIFSKSVRRQSMSACQSVFAKIALTVLLTMSAGVANATFIVQQFEQTAGSISSLAEAQALIDSVSPTQATAATIDYADGGFSSAGNFAGFSQWLNNDGGGEASELNDTFAIKVTAMIAILSAGNYTFATSSDDGVRLDIGGVPIINNGAPHAITEDLATIALDAGNHLLELVFYENDGESVLELSAAQGTHTGAVNGLFCLVGDAACVGALQTVSAPESVPVPPVFMLFFIGFAGLLASSNFSGRLCRRLPKVAG